ncbi:MAG: hypothetical protein JST92_26440 [Deltaproteobacteria bacterium]|nr:hypothetical protein [Deltaproteobacteria bacterium]
MDCLLAGTILTRDVIAADGRVIANRGEIVDLEFLKEVTAKAPKGLRSRPLHETSIADSVLEALDAAPLEHILAPTAARGQVADALADVRFPDEIWHELESMRVEDPARFTHAVWTSLVAARMFRTALGEAPGIPRMLGGALVHDLGMRLASPKLRGKRDFLNKAEAAALEDHPLLGALLLASVLGDAPPVHFALLHHVRSGHGYPRVKTQAPLRGLDLISVASAFAAMVSPRAYRAQPFSPRGAIDQLLEEAQAGHFDERAVRLLIFCMRGAKGALGELRLPKQLTGFRPMENNHGVVLEEAK